MKNNGRALITGGAGFIGSHLTRHLLAAGYEVTILDLLSPQIHGLGNDYIPPAGVRFIYGDIRDKESVSKALEEVNIVFHLAAETGTGQSMYEVERYVSVNEVGTAVLLECIGQTKGKVTDLMLASSRSIYGEGAYLGDDGVIYQPASRSFTDLSNGEFEYNFYKGTNIKPIATPESLPQDPGSIYAATKYSQEMLCKLAAVSLNLRLSIFRLQNVYGEGQSLKNPYTGIISIFYNLIRQRLPINIFEDGLESRDFVHVDDVVKAMTSALERGSRNGLVLNIGTGIPTSVLCLADTLINVSGFDAKKNVTGNFRVGDIRHCYADLSRAKREIGFEPQVTLEEGLLRFCNWAIDQPVYPDQSEEALSKLTMKGLAK